MDFFYLLQRDLAPEYHPPHSLARPEFGCFGIRAIRLGRQMDFGRRPDFLDESDDTRVGDDQGIGLHLFQLFDIWRQFFQMLVMGEDVNGYISLLFKAMGIFNRLFQSL